MKRIHILQHAQSESSGCIEKWVEERSYSYNVTEVYTGKLLPDVSEIDWLVIMGGGMSVHDTDELPWLIDEKRLIKECIHAGKVILGICLGSQLIAEALGSRVYKNRMKEIGWFPVMRINSGEDPAILKKFNSTETVFHWHGDTFDIPEGARCIFTSDVCKNQCLIYNERTLGLQFHLEVTENLLECMIISGSDEIVPGGSVQNENQMRVGASNI